LIFIFSQNIISPNFSFGSTLPAKANNPLASPDARMIFVPQKSFAASRILDSAYCFSSRKTMPNRELRYSPNNSEWME